MTGPLPPALPPPPTPGSGSQPTAPPPGASNPTWPGYPPGPAYGNAPYPWPVVPQPPVGPQLQRRPQAPFPDWWKQASFVAAMLLCCPPIGLGLMWAYAPWEKTVKQALTGVAAGWLLLVLMLAAVSPRRDIGNETALTATSGSAIGAQTTTTSSSTTTTTVAPTMPRTTEPAPPPDTAPPETAAPETAAVYYSNCDAARDAGAAPIHPGEPGYSTRLDRDGDGLACE